MKVQSLLLIGALITGLGAETVVKNSKAFTFPVTVGVRGGNSLSCSIGGAAAVSGRGIIYSCTGRVAGRVTFNKAGYGKISLKAGEYVLYVKTPESGWASKTFIVGK